MQKRRKDFKSERRENSIAGKKYGIISFTLTLVIFLVHLIFGELLLGPVSLRTHLLVTWLVSFSLYLSHTTHTHTLFFRMYKHTHSDDAHTHTLTLIRMHTLRTPHSERNKVLASNVERCEGAFEYLRSCECVCEREKETFLLKD